MQGRSPTCYSPVRHSSTPEGAFPFDLHVLSTPPAFVLSQDQTLQTKTPGTNPAIFHQRKSDQSKTPKTGIKKTPHPNTGSQSMAKNNNKQKPPNTLLSSQTTHPLGRATSPRQKPRTRSADDQEPTEVGFPLGAAALFGLGPCRSDESTSYVRENLESNGLIGRVFRLVTYRAHRGASAPSRSPT